jgi:plastocyanin
MLLIQSNFGGNEMKLSSESKSRAISTMVVAIIVVVIVVIAGAGIYFATSTSSSNTATTSSTAVTTSTTQSFFETTSSSTPSSASTTYITIPDGAGNASDPNNFIPNTVSVIAGTTIVFVNKDTVTHDIYFTSVPSGATISPNPSPNTPQWTNNTFSVTLTVPGTYVYSCQYHSWMNGVIQVN